MSMLTIRQYRTLRHARDYRARRMTPAGLFWTAYAVGVVCLIGALL